MSLAIDIQQVAADASLRLLELSRRTFFDAFAHLNKPDDMALFAQQTFTPAAFEQQLNNPDSEFYFAIVEGATAGYLKLNYHLAQTEFQEANALEVERIYVLQEYQGRQIGKQLIDFAIKKAMDKQLAYIWLGVWEHNVGAIRFYKSRGFTIFGSHAFLLGNDRQTDLLMRKELI